MKEERDRLKFSGVVIDGIKDIFNVQVDDNYVVRCTLSGKIRQNFVRILPGDTVEIEVSMYDTGKGRIIYRSKKGD